MRRSLGTIVFVIAALTGTAFAQEFALEGKINALRTENGAQIITVMGTDVQIPAGVAISTPTGTVPFSGPGGLTDPALPSLIEAATAIISGTRSGGVNVAHDVFIEVAENVMFGDAEAVDAAKGEITINGTGRIRINAPGSGVGDPRFEAVIYPSAGFSVFSDTGYPMALAGTTTCTQTNPADPLSPWVPSDSRVPCAPSAGELISAEGDYRSDPTTGEKYLAAHTVEVGKLVLYNPANVVGNKDYLQADEVAVIEGTRLSIRGFGTFGGGRVFVYRAQADCTTIISQLLNGSGAAVSAGMSAADGRFRFDKAAFAGSNSFTHILLRTGTTTGGPNPSGATVCVPVQR